MRSRGGRNPTPRQEKAMTYYFTRTLDMPFDRAVAHVTEALAAKGFGVLTTIDVKPYVILGACNPKLAWGALQAEDKIGTMLPCNVIVTEAAPGKVEVAAVDPVASMSAIRNPALGEIAGNVRQMLSDVVDGL
jgi:uncharacterized protein (DUF302 family)